METKVQFFQNSEFGNFRTIVNAKGDPFFCATDITTILGYKNGRKAVTDNCSPKGVTTGDTLTKGGLQTLTYISESNLYRLVMKSKLPDAEKFQDWVCEEVLPAIRRDGGYIVTKAGDTDESIMARALIIATNTMDSLKAKNRLLESCNQDNVKRLEEQAPKVLFSDSVTASKGTFLIRDLSTVLNQRGVNIGQNRLFKWLRENGYLCSIGVSYNHPTQMAKDLKLFELIPRTVGDPGKQMVTYTTYVTGKGLTYFVNKFLFNKK